MPSETRRDLDQVPPVGQGEAPVPSNDDVEISSFRPEWQETIEYADGTKVTRTFRLFAKRKKFPARTAVMLLVAVVLVAAVIARPELAIDIAKEMPGVLRHLGP